MNLYIDGNFGCGPVMPSGFCTSSVKAGSHLLEARKGGDPSTTIMSQPNVNIGDGTSPTWTVSYEVLTTVEGVWEVVSVSSDGVKSLIGNKISISRKGNDYEVKGSDNSTWIYTGNERRIVHTELEYLINPTDVNEVHEGDEKPPAVVNQFKGQQVQINYSFTLSADSNSLTREQDSKQFYWQSNPQTGEVRNVRYKIMPGFYKRTLKRVSGPASKPMQ